MTDHDPFPEQTGHGPGASFFDSLRRAGLVRTEERWFGGVASGVAMRIGVDPLLVRGIAIVLSFFGGLGLLLYGLAWALLPEQTDGRIHLQEALRGHFHAGLVGAMAMVILDLSWPAFRWRGLWWGEAWTVIGVLITAAIVVAVLVWAVPQMRTAGGEASAGDPESAGAPAPTRPPQTAPDTATLPGVGATAATAAPARAPSSSAPPPAPPQGREDRGGAMVYAVLGLALLALAATQIAGRVLDWDGSLWLLGGGAVLVVLGLGIVVNGIRGRTAGGMGHWSVLVATLVVPLTFTLAAAPQVRDALSIAPHHLGDSSWVPRSTEALADGHVHTAGRVRADLSAIPAGTSLADPVQITLAAGQLLVDVPSDVDVDVRVQGTGSLRVEQPGSWHSHSAQVHTGTDIALLREVRLHSSAEDGPADLMLELAVGAGGIVIRQVPPAVHRSSAPADHSGASASYTSATASHGGATDQPREG